MTSFDGRSQRLKPCAGGCGLKTRAVRCRECFAKIPARDRAGAFVRFQLRRSHLVTNGDTVADVLPSITPAQAAGARLTIAELALRNTGTNADAVDATRQVINMLEIGDVTGQEFTV